MTEHVHTGHAHAAHAPHGGHSDRDYIRIWAILCGLLVVSVVGPMLEIRLITLITAFGIALVKAYLVARHFMHLSIEKRWVGYILVAMIAFMVVMFGGLAPDIMRDGGQHWDKTYVEPPIGAASPAGKH